MTDTNTAAFTLYTDLDVDYHDGRTFHHVFTQGEVVYDYKTLSGGVLEFRDDHEVVVIPLSGIHSLHLSEYDPATRTDAKPS